MNRTREQAIGSIRLSLSKYTTDVEVNYLLEKLPPIIRNLREVSPKEANVEKVSP